MMADRQITTKIHQLLNSLLSAIAAILNLESRMASVLCSVCQKQRLVFKNKSLVIRILSSPFGQILVLN
jgi:hypothetical protein